MANTRLLCHPIITCTKHLTVAQGEKLRHCARPRGVLPASPLPSRDLLTSFPRVLPSVEMRRTEKKEQCEIDSCWVDGRLLEAFYSAALSRRDLGAALVSVSMETLTSTWAPVDRCDVIDAGATRRNSSRVREACVLSRSPPAGGLWSEQLPPHLHRNKQLEDALRRRDEEMARLRDENDKLRRFLDRSSGDLNQKSSADRTKNLNRKRPYHVGRFQNSALRHLRVTEHVCRNLSSEFSSTEFGSDESGTAASEPAPDLWVLRTLGPKDPAAVDVSSPLARQIESHRSDFSHGGPEGPRSPPAFSASTPNRSGPPPGHLFPEETRFGQAPFSDPVPNWSRTPQTPWRVNCPEGGRPDLAFAMSLSPASSVKTLSYPQGQAFVRTDPKGRYNFTWLPTRTSRYQDLGGGLEGPRKPRDLRLLHGT
ncbi:geminin coiled-coil domain-containing protein 1 [Phycodurus eques]|uniref:geminin coiled-coil domain-containing protein 1 n=1 Tax=Phycodurus eques TaxID=693459 RepID=UPI002ACEED2A|nr:geminin coiled-coil domain-containing protein 1 [Phycodurus eques]